jgi:hypothetical protein
MRTFTEGEVAKKLGLSLPELRSWRAKLVPGSGGIRRMPSWW